MRLNPTLHDDLFMPAAERPVHNNWINFAGKKYYAEELRPWNGEKVLVRYDMHDPHYIVVQTPDMVKICRALVDGNTIDYRSMISEAERKAGESQRAKLARAQAQVQKKLPGATVVYNEDSIGATATVVNSIRPIGQVVDVEPMPALEPDFPDEDEGTVTQSVRPARPGLPSSSLTSGTSTIWLTRIHGRRKTATGWNGTSRPKNTRIILIFS